jgi:type 1 glutamine amidotransferase
MARRWVVAAAVAAAALVMRVEAGEKIKLHLVQGGGHDWKGSFAILAGILEKMGDFEVTASEDLDELKADNIKKYNVVLFYGSGNDFKDPEQEKGLCDFVRNGGAWVGIHSATDSFKKSDAYWEMVGGRFAGHGGGKFPVRIVDKDHPITKGLEDFEIEDETYSHNYHKNMCIRTLTRMDRDKEQQAMAWVSYYGKGRVFYTANGHGREAWVNPAFQRLAVRGLYWAAGREPKDPPQP